MNERQMAEYLWRRQGWVGRIGRWARPKECTFCGRSKKCKRYLVNESMIVRFVQKKKSHLKFLKGDCPDLVNIFDEIVKPAEKGK